MTRAAKTSRPRKTGSPKGKPRAPRSSGSSRTSGKAGRGLVIVESPAKARTINRYLGGGYVVKASMGHVRDLPARNPKGVEAPVPGVDVEHGFAPTYEPLPGRRKVLAELKKQARSAETVFLATDLDREGEAIAWHLAESLPVPGDRIRRVVFNEITPSAIREAFARPRGLDMDKVNAQQARRILDRIVGYEVSPLLWRKVSPGLSAGRVQSVAVRLIVERERQIDAFEPQEYWRVGLIFAADAAAAEALRDPWARLLARRDEKGNPPTRQQQQEFLAEHGAFRAELTRLAGEKFQPDNETQALAAAKALGLAVEDIRRREDDKAKGAARNVVEVAGRVADQPPAFTVRELKTRETRSKPPAPFTTAALQQQAAVRLRFSASRTMRVAQQLYEGVEVPGEGSVGLITYMRTDSRHLSRESVAQCRELIERQFGRDYLPDKPRTYASAARAQEAHEAIRPTDAARDPKTLASALTDEQRKLYDLIWRQFVACQMTPAVWTVTDADIHADTPQGDAAIRAMGRRLKFDGYYRVAGRPRGGDQILPPLDPGQNVHPVEIAPTQHFTQPPPRYTEASLVKALEADGIGRPSTYAAIIQTIQDREYVRQTDRAFHPTDLGIVVTDKLVKHFPNVFDVRFTAHLEDELDKVEESHADWVKVLEEFYGPFHERLERAAEEMVHAKAETQPSDYTCESCGRPMVYRFSRNGRYLACTGYPECKQTHPVDKDGRKIEQPTVDVACPKCGAPMVLRRGRFGPFLSCSKYPECDGIVKLDKKGGIKPPSPPPLATDLPCPKCEAPMNLRRSARGPWLSCSKYPKCRGRLAWKGLPEEQRKELELALMNHEKAHPVPQLKRLDGTPIERGEPPRQVSSANSTETTKPG